jgi:hypothetical protein
VCGPYYRKQECNDFKERQVRGAQTDPDPLEDFLSLPGYKERVSQGDKPQDRRPLLLVLPDWGTTTKAEARQGKARADCCPSPSPEAEPPPLPKPATLPPKRGIVLAGRIHCSILLPSITLFPF